MQCAFFKKGTSWCVRNTASMHVGKFTTAFNAALFLFFYSKWRLHLTWLSVMYNGLN